MSYLDFPRIHITGGFFTDPSSVDNDPYHFDPAKGPPSPWQMPAGKHHFKLTGCTVVSAFNADGSEAGEDNVISSPFVSTDLFATPPMGTPTAPSGTVPVTVSPAKLVDLDPYQQAVSTLYGLQISLQVDVNNTIVGNLTPGATLNSTWFGRTLPTRAWNDSGGQSSYGDDANAVGTFQSQLRIPIAQWNVSNSPVLTALRDATYSDGTYFYLSFKMVLDSYINTFYGSPETNCYQGRLVATIGPVLSADEPVQTLGARWLQPRPAPDASNPMPWYYPKFYGAPFKVDTLHNKLHLDLGGSLTTTGVAVRPVPPPDPTTGEAPLTGPGYGEWVGGGPVDLGVMTAVITSPGQPAVTIGLVDYQTTTYIGTAGIVTLDLTTTQAALLESAPLSLQISRADIIDFNKPQGSPFVLAENPNGMWWMTDTRSVRVASDHPDYQTATTKVYATQWGKPAANLQLGIEVVSVVKGIPGMTVPPSYPGNTPEAAGALEATVSITDSAGIATVTLTAVKDCGSRMPWLNSQLYFVDLYQGTPWGKTAQIQEQQISVVQWAEYTVNPTPLWPEIQAMMEPYVTIYPAMRNTLVDLTDEHSFLIYGWNPPWAIAFGFPEGYSALGMSAGAIPLYLTRSVEDPRYMPVSRDLSPNRILTILNFIKNNVPPSGTTPTTGAA